MARYTVLLVPDTEVGGYTASIPAIPAIVTEGDNREHALAMAREAIELYLAAAKDHGWEIPTEVAPPELASVEVEASPEVAACRREPWIGLGWHPMCASARRIRVPASARREVHMHSPGHKNDRPEVTDRDRRDDTAETFMRDARNAFGETLPADRIGGDETGATTGVDPGEAPIVPRDAGQTPIGDDPSVLGGGHGEGP